MPDSNSSAHTKGLAAPRQRPPVLLTSAGYNGTLAATRSLGRAGVRVILADNDRFAPAMWSRFTAERKACPNTLDPERFIEWLLSVGKRTPGIALIPTSDDTAWLFSRYQRELAAYFQLSLPAHDVIHGVLNKRKLYAHCLAAGVDAPTTWMPNDASEAIALVEQLNRPLVLKPRTQVLFPSREKGMLVPGPDAAAQAYRQFACLKHARMITDADPEISLPLLQEFYVSATRSVYSITGFAGDDGEIWGARGGVKVLQRPPHLGIGLCFEDAPLEPEPLDAVRRMLETTGFRGVFEVEFVPSDGKYKLIDFNPRFYSQMAFDLHRGLPLAELAYATAIRDSEQLRALRARIEEASERESPVFLHRVPLEAILALARVITGNDNARVRGWIREHRDHSTDAVLDADDRLPGVFDAARTLFHFAAHPRSTYRQAIRAAKG
jgi:D-aspartate ligase